MYILAILIDGDSMYLYRDFRLKVTDFHKNYTIFAILQIKLKFWNYSYLRSISVKDKSLNFSNHN